MAQGARAASCLLSGLRDAAALDPRSLALFRIALALLLLANLAQRAPVFSALYGDAGAFPRHLVAPATPGFAELYFAYLLAGSPPALWALALLSALCALLLALGLRTRLAAAASWFLLVSLNTRNPFATSYEDSVLTLLLFFGCFLPLGARFSLDARRAARPAPARVVSGASIALLVQFAAIYLFTALLKTGPAWHEEASALAYTLGQSYAARPLAAAALAHPEILAGATRLTRAFELGIGCALLSPLANGPLRALAVLSVWGFHAALALLLAIGLFPWVMMAGALALAPSWLWERLPARVQARAPVSPPAPGPRGVRAWLLHGAPLAALALALAANVAGLVDGRLPAPLAWLAGTLRLEQAWRMYAPEPERYDYFYAFPGTLADGRRVDLARGGAALTSDPPERQPWRPAPRPWALFLDHARVHRRGGAGRALGAWLCRSWNAAHAGGARLLRVEWVMERFEMDRGRERRTRPLGAWACGDAKAGITLPAR
jgi:hypothetical protein